MKVTSTKFMRGVVGEDDILEDGTPQIAFIGRSNVGKSSLLNSLTGSKKLAITSKTPGRTKEINVFLINDTHYFMDLPGYGFAKAGFQVLDKLSELIFWYLFNSNHNQKVVLLIDAVVGPTTDDLNMLRELEKAGKEIVVVLNKVDKIKKSQYRNQLEKLSKQIIGHKLFPYSSKSKVGIEELSNELLLEKLQ
ncbi:MAG: GTP-binding protein [Candidatus Paceibacteria bacterium]|jgi:GTP-binding protein